MRPNDPVQKVSELKDSILRSVKPKEILDTINPIEILPKVKDTLTTLTQTTADALDLTNSVRIAELKDESGHMEDFAIRFISGSTLPLAPDSLVPRLAKIVYVGPDRTWSERPVIDADGNRVTFRTVSDYHTVECTLTFRDIIGFSLSGAISDGRPEISFQTVNDFSMVIEYSETMNTIGIKRYLTKEFNWFAERNGELYMFYGDVFFDIPSRERNPRLMTAALGLELAASTAEEGDLKRSHYIKELLGDIGCEHVFVNEVYDSEPSVETTDVAIGSKVCDGCNLIYLVLSGAHYVVEFAANVMLGRNGEHTGFALAREEGLTALREFISEYGIKGRTKLLVVGYSRTAAGANLLGKYVSDAIAENAVKRRIGDIELSQDDLYVYCFETPLCGYFEEGDYTIRPDDPRYDSIWYFTNPDDPVTYVPTERYGFVRYGRRIILNPDHDPEVNARMLSYIQAYYGRDAVAFYDLLRFTKVRDLRYMEDVNKGFIDKFFSALGTREFYYENVERDFVRSVYIGTTKTALLRDVVKELGGIRGCLTTLHTYSRDKDRFLDVLKPAVERSAEKYDCSEYSDSITNSAFQIMNLVERYCDGRITKFIRDKHLRAMLLNVGKVIKAHYPDVTFAYLMMDDPDYAEPYVETDDVTEEEQESLL